MLYLTSLVTGRDTITYPSRCKSHFIICDRSVIVLVSRSYRSKSRKKKLLHPQPNEQLTRDGSQENHYPTVLDPFECPSPATPFQCSVPKFAIPSGTCKSQFNRDIRNQNSHSFFWNLGTIGSPVPFACSSSWNDNIQEDLDGFVNDFGGLQLSSSSRKRELLWFVREKLSRPS
jgi:hypothetical protein